MIMEIDNYNKMIIMIKMLSFVNVNDLWLTIKKQFLTKVGRNNKF